MELRFPAAVSAGRSVFEPEVLCVVPSEPVLAEFRDFVLRETQALLRPSVRTMSSLDRALRDELGGRLVDPWASAFFMERLSRELWEVLGLPEEPPASLASELAAGLGDGLRRIRLAGIGWDKVEGLSPEPLARKTAELGRRYEGWLLSQGLQDEEGLRRKAVEELGKGRPFRALKGVKTVRFLRFQRLLPFEADLVKALAARHEVTVSLTGPGWVSDKSERGRAGALKRMLIEDLESFRQNAEGSRLPGRGPAPEAPARGDLELCLTDVATGEGDELMPGLPPVEAPEVLRFAAGNLFGPPPKGGPPSLAGSPLRVIRAPNRYMECENAVRLAKSLAAEGTDPSRIAIVVPSLQEYLPMLDDCARRFGTRLLHRGGELLERCGPALAVLDILSLLESGYDRRRVARALASPYLDFGCGKRELLEGVRGSGIADDRAGAGFGRSPALDRGHPAVRAVGRLRRLQSELQAAASWGAFLVVFRQALAELSWGEDRTLESGPGLRRPLTAAPAASGEGAGAAARLSALAEAQLERDREAADLFRGVLDSLGTALEASPEAPEPGIKAFRKWLGEAMADERVAGPEDGQDPSGRIRVHNYYRIHGAFMEALFLLGLNEGSFPAARAEGAFWPAEFADGFRRLRAGRSLWTNASERCREDEETAAAALAQARRVFVMFSAKTPEGKDALPAALVTSLAGLFESDGPEGRPDPKTPEGGKAERAGKAELARDAEPEGKPEGKRKPKPQGRLVIEDMGRAVPPEPRLLASPEELRLHLIRLPEASIPAALKAAGEGPAFCRPLSPLLPQAPSRLKYPEERLEAWLRSLASHEGRPVVYIGHLTDYAACPRKFWYGHILGIQPEPEADAQWSSRDQGTLLHSVLEEFLAPLAGLKPGERPPGLVSSRRLIGIFREKAREAENLAEMVSEEGEDRAPERPGKAAEERKTGSLGRLPVFRDSLAKLERALLRWHFREDGFPNKILAVEWRFGRGKSRRGEAAADGAQARGGAPSAPPLKVESESGAFYMEGRLDRVDRLPDGGLRVIDYKMRHSGYYAGKPKPEALSPSAGGFPLRPVGIRVSHCQLLVYRLAAERYLLGRASARYEFMSPPHEKSFIEGDPGGPEVLSALWENLLERHTEPADGLTDEATCAYCDYARLCGRRRA